jgi:hypothetical protein
MLFPKNNLIAYQQILFAELAFDIKILGCGLRHVLSWLSNLISQAFYSFSEIIRGCNV